MPSSTLLDKIYPKVIKRKKSTDDRIAEALNKALEDLASDLAKRQKEQEGERGDEAGE